MNKLFIQALAILISFFTLWFALSKVNWIHILKVEQAASNTEEKLGDLFWEIYNTPKREITSTNATAPLDSLFSKICTANNIDKSQIKLHLVNSDEINAFALPDKHLVVNSALILASENEAELCGVIGHELAHIELNHVMKTLVKEVGLSVLISMTAGNGGGDAIKEAAKLLSSSAYDRKLEKEADIKSVDYLIESNINPEPFANFLFRLGDGEPSNMKYFSWISTHPDSKERAEYIIEYMGDRAKVIKPVLAESTWEQLKLYLDEASINNQ